MLKINGTSVSSETTSGGITRIIGVSKGKERRGYTEKHLKKIFKFDENYKPIDPSSSMNSKHMKCEENYTEAHYNQTGQKKFLKRIDFSKAH